MKRISSSQTKLVVAFCSLAALIVIAATSTARANLIDFNYTTDNNPNDAPNGPTPSPYYGVMSGGAVLGGPGDIWNNTFGSQPTDTISNLKDSSGAVTGVSFTETGLTGIDANGSADNFQYNLYNTFQHLPGFGGGVPNATLTFNGLAPNLTYEFVLYGFNADAAGGGVDSGRSIIATNDGTTYTLEDQSNSSFVSTNVGTNTYEGNYLIMDVKTGASGSFTTDLLSGQQDAISGFQLELVGVPEPSTWALLAAGMVGLAWVRRKSALT